MEAPLLTPKCTLLPSKFFDPASARDTLGEVVELSDSDEIKYVEVPQYDAVLIYSDYDKVSGGHVNALPELFYVLQALPQCQEYNKIVATWSEGFLYLSIAQGDDLLLANVYKAQNFATAQYFIFLAVKSLQLNPEVSTICWRSELGPEDKMSLYRYFKAVEQI